MNLYIQLNLKQSKRERTSEPGQQRNYTFLNKETFFNWKLNPITNGRNKELLVVKVQNEVVLPLSLAHLVTKNQQQSPQLCCVDLSSSVRPVDCSMWWLQVHDRSADSLQTRASHTDIGHTMNPGHTRCVFRSFRFHTSSSGCVNIDEHFLSIHHKLYNFRLCIRFTARYQTSTPVPEQPLNCALRSFPPLVF